MQLINGDAIEEMAKLEDNSVDLILTDPPYNISRDNNFHTMGRAGIDFGEWDYNHDLEPFFAEFARSLKSGGSLVVFNAWKNLGCMAKWGESQGLEVKDMIRLRKQNPMPRNKDRRYITDYECAVWFTKPGAKWIFNRQDAPYQRPEVEVPVKKGKHPTEKAINAMEWLILTHSNKGDVVLDPFMGSGTTGVAAKNLGRDFIGIELEPEYFKIAEDRIKNTFILPTTKRISKVL